jgi:hypothetical protein
MSEFHKVFIAHLISLILDFLIKELVETIFAVVKESFSEVTELDSLKFGFLASQIEFKSDNSFAEITIKIAIFFFVLGFSEDSLHDQVHVVFIKLSC